jgi:hypothetical protein
MKVGVFPGLNPSMRQTIPKEARHRFGSQRLQPAGTREAITHLREQVGHSGLGRCGWVWQGRS